MRKGNILRRAKLHGRATPTFNFKAFGGKQALVLHQLSQKSLFVRPLFIWGIEGFWFTSKVVVAVGGEFSFFRRTLAVVCVDHEHCILLSPAQPHDSFCSQIEHLADPAPKLHLHYPSYSMISVQKCTIRSWAGSLSNLRYVIYQLDFK